MFNIYGCNIDGAISELNSIRPIYDIPLYEVHTTSNLGVLEGTLSDGCRLYTDSNNVTVEMLEQWLDKLKISRVSVANKW